jgi:membrane-bound inhibitor of C-type lysozyme
MPTLLRRLLLLASVALLAAASLAQAGGGSSAPDADSKGAGNNRVVGQASFRCKGGIRVQVTQMPDRARVDFAGRSQVLKLVPDSSGTYQNSSYTWFTKGKVSYMKNMNSGGLDLSGCVATQ